MWKLPQPTCSALSAYETCTQNIKDKSLKERFQKAKPDVQTADTVYREAAQSLRLTDLDASDFALSGLSSRELVDLYDRRMAAQRSPGRAIYDSIRISSRNGRCPLCGHREVMTLDHFLPKSRYPALAVNPINLIPACTDCNRAKNSSIDPILNPYYDNVQHEVWLYTKIIPSGPPAATFFVACPQSWPQSISERISNHFKVFKLGVLYSSQAARTISGNRLLLVELFRKGGELLVRKHLEDQARTWLSYELNCWEASLYTGLASSPWFCTGGFSAT